MRKIYSFLVLLLCNYSVHAAIQIVTVANHAFTPSSFIINLGDTVRWVWSSGIHTTTSVTIPSGAAAWNSNITSGTTSYTYVPAKTGTYNYKCTPHAAMGMTAVFTVACPAVTVQITASGPTTFCKGGSVTINSVTNGTSYQWKKNGGAVSGSTSPTKKVTGTGAFSLTVSNSCGSSATSNTINVTVISLPAAVINPSDTVDICPGDSVKLTANTASSLSYQWLRNGTNIQGATARNYYAKQAGNFKVRVTKNATGCSKLSVFTRVNINCRSLTGYDENFQAQIYPCPSNGNFKLDISGFDGEELNVRVYDFHGNILEKFTTSKAENTFGENLASGNYLVEIVKGDKSVQRTKIIKVK